MNMKMPDGTEIEVESKTVMLPMDDSLQEALNGLSREGWLNAGGFVPQVVYHLVRMKQPPQAEPLGKMTIDESKVHLIRNGEIVPPGSD